MKFIRESVSLTAVFIIPSEIGDHVSPQFPFPFRTLELPYILGKDR